MSWALQADLAVRRIVRDSELLRRRRQAILWEAPVLFISAAVVVLALFIIVFGPAE